MRMQWQSEYSIDMRLVTAAFVLFLAMPVWAQQYGANKPLGAAAQSAPAFLKKAGISQNLGNQLPLSDHFVDSSGANVTLGTYFEHRPVVMALVYYKCKMLCPQVLSGMAGTLRQVGFAPGKDYDIVVASIDPGDTPADGAAGKSPLSGLPRRSRRRIECAFSHWPAGLD